MADTEVHEIERILHDDGGAIDSPHDVADTVRVKPS